MSANIKVKTKWLYTENVLNNAGLYKFTCLNAKRIHLLLNRLLDSKVPPFTWQDVGSAVTIGAVTLFFREKSNKKYVFLRHPTMLTLIRRRVRSDTIPAIIQLVQALVPNKITNVTFPIEATSVATESTVA